MTKKQFDIRYGEKGGVEKFEEMRTNLSSLKQISDQFGITRERIRQLAVDLFGEKYDPRKERRDLKVSKIKEVIKTRGLDEAEKEFNNGYYIKEAIKTLK